MKRILFLLFTLIFLASCSSENPTEVTEKSKTGSLLHPQYYSFLPFDSSDYDDFMLLRPQYILDYNHIRNCANWAFYRLVASDFGSIERTDRFRIDTCLPDSFAVVKSDDYIRSGYDRGHLVKSDDRTATLEDNLSVFWMSNIVPQSHELNSGVWARLENYADTLAFNGDTLYILTGCIWNAAHSYVAGKIEIPDKFFRIVYNVTERTTSAIIMPNDTSLLSSWQKYSATVDEIETASGYKFYRLK